MCKYITEKIAFKLKCLKKPKANEHEKIHKYSSLSSIRVAC